jgi:hypothetical protein
MRIRNQQLAERDNTDGLRQLCKIMQYVPKEVYQNSIKISIIQCLSEVLCDWTEN